MDTSKILLGKRIRAIADSVMNSEEFHGNQEERGRAGDPPLACAADEDVAKQHALWRNPNPPLDATHASHATLEARWDATHASSAGECARRSLRGLRGKFFARRATS